MAGLTSALLAVAVAANPWLDQGRKAYEALRYREAEAQLRVARDVATSTPGERRQVLELLALSLIAQGRLAEAEDAFAQLLVLAPEAAAAQDWAPKVRAAFLRAKERVYPPGYVRLELGPAPADRLDVAVVDPWGRVRGVFAVAPDGASGGGEALALRAGRAAGARPHGPFRLEARGEDGAVLQALEVGAPPALAPAASAPSATSPALSPAAAAPRPPRWPHWLLLGTAVAAAGASATLAGLSADASQRAGAATFASDTWALDRQATAQAQAAWVLGGVAVATGGAAAVLFFTW